MTKLIVLLCVLPPVVFAAARRLALRSGRTRFFSDCAHWWRCWREGRPHLVVGSEPTPYLRRWWLIPHNPRCNIFVHQFLRDDAYVMHDHPRASVSLLLSGVLREAYVGDDAPGVAPGESRHGIVESLRWIRPGSIVYRSATFAHRLALPPGRTAWTLFGTGPWRRTWGFHTADGWVPYNVFFGAR